jgi:lipopolysaccharide biosynthesis regulator YciM
MARNSKYLNLQARNKDKNIVNYKCKNCSSQIYWKYTVCPSCGEYHPDDEARTNWPPAKISLNK